MQEETSSLKDREEVQFSEEFVTTLSKILFGKQ